MQRLQKILLRTHIAAWILAILNSLFKNFTAYRLAGNIEFGIELIAVLSGLILFFFYLKPFKNISFYFSIYATAAFLSIIGIVFRGIPGALILSAILYPIIPDKINHEQHGIIISSPFRGMMAPCCQYQISERKLFIFEKNYGIFEPGGPINFKTMKVKSNRDEIELTYTTDFDSASKKKVIKK